MSAVRRPLLIVALLLTGAAGLACLPLPAAYAQKSRATSRPRVERKTLYVTVTAVNGTTAVLNPDAGGGPFTAFLTAKTKFYRAPARATNPGFLLNERLVVRVESVPGPSDARAAVIELWDTALYEEQSRHRKELCTGTVRQTISGGMRSGSLIVEDQEGGEMVTFHVTDKTMFRKGDLAVPPSAYPPGATAVVKPRSLPNNGVMASIVAESEEAAERAYKDTLSVWKGVVIQVDIAPRFYIIIKRSDGALRGVNLPSTLMITDEKTRKEVGPRKTYLLGELRDKPVTVRLLKGERPAPNGTRTASQITVNPSVERSLEPRDPVEPDKPEAPQK